MNDEGSTAATAPAATETNQPTTNTEAAPEQTTEPAKEQTTEPAKVMANIPEDQIEAFNKFVDSNGGYEKAFAKLKSAVSAPAQPTTQPAEPAKQPATPAPQPAAQTQQVPDGFMTNSEYIARRYFKDLASEEEFKPIADEITSGKAITEMSELGMTPVRDGMWDDKNIRKFLSMKVKAVTAPAKPTAAPISSTPTVEYVNVGDKIETIDDARKVMAQNQTLSGSQHPLTQQAKDFIKAYYAKK